MASALREFELSLEDREFPGLSMGITMQLVRPENRG